MRVVLHGILESHNGVERSIEGKQASMFLVSVGLARIGQGDGARVVSRNAKGRLRLCDGSLRGNCLVRDVAAVFGVGAGGAFDICQRVLLAVL